MLINGDTVCLIRSKRNSKNQRYSNNERIWNAAFQKLETLEKLEIRKCHLVWILEKASAPHCLLRDIWDRLVTVTRGMVNPSSHYYSTGKPSTGESQWGAEGPGPWF